MRSYDRQKREAGPPIIRKRVASYDLEDWESLEDQLRYGLSVNDLSDDQKVVFDKVIAWFAKALPLKLKQTSLFTLGGYAGTGKSTLTAILAKSLQNSAQLDRRLRIAFCAYTGKAANVLKQKLRQEGVEASALGLPHYAGTIHSLMYAPVVASSGEVIDWKKRGELQEYDLIVVDEASMVDGQVFQDLASYRVPILAVGDHGQLPPVKGDGSLMLNPMVRLEQIHRQAQDNPIIALSQYVREQGDLPERWNNTENVRFLTFNEMQSVLEPLYQVEKPENIAILTYTNKCRQSMNYQGRCMRNRRDMPPEPVPDDQVICLRNMKGMLFNGMRGRIEGPLKEDENWYRGKFFFPDDEIEVEGDVLRAQIGREKTFNSFDEINEKTGLYLNKWGHVGMLFDYGYAMTVHKSQGSQFKHVFLIYEKPRFVEADDFSRWLYTGITRASKNIYIVVG